MSCICQYLVNNKQRILNSDCQSDIFAIEQAHVTDKGDVSASELAAAKAEIWILKKNLSDAQISIENLENLLRMMIQKQNELKVETFEVQQQNMELQEECRLQRDYQVMERNAMLRELNDVKKLLNIRTKLLEESMEKNATLTRDVQDAHEKVYMMGVKFLKLKTAQSKCSSTRSTSTVHTYRSE